MASPAKRRKTNKDGAVQASGSLDFFFAKQQKRAEEAKQVDIRPKEIWQDTEAGNGLQKHGSLEADATNGALTDEEIARKLQAEWDREDAVLRTSQQEARNDDVTNVDPGVDNDAPATPAATAKTDMPEAKHDTSPAMKTNPFLSLQTSAASEDSMNSTIPFDESPLTFTPSKYIDGLRTEWRAANADKGDATYSLLTRGFVLINQTTSRIKIVDTLVNVLRTLIEADPDSLLPAVWLATNSIAPPYEDLELGLGGSAISKALKKTCGLDNNGLRTLYNKYGDAGDVAFEAKKRQSFTLRKPKPLSIRGVYESLLKIAKSKGTGSVENKQRIVERLVQDARGAEESRYIVRTLVQHLRIGAVKTTMLIALSRAFMLSRPPDGSYPTKTVDDLRKLKKDALTELYKEREETVKACFARRPNYNDLVPMLLTFGVTPELLLHCPPTLHIPLRPMLGSITRDLQEMLVKLGQSDRAFSCEYKYDGQRAQVHCDSKGRVSIFSRHLERMTDKYPDLVELVPRMRGDGVESFVLEGEVVAIDTETGALRTFQQLSNRARKDVAATAVSVEVCLFAFDLMFLNGEELLSRSFRERRNLLRSLFVEIPRRFTWVKSIDASPTEDAERVLEFFRGALDAKCEGIMVKVLDNVSINELNGGEDAAKALSDKDDQVPQPTTPSKTTRKARPKSHKGGDGNVPDAEKEKGSGRRKPLLATYEPDKRLESWLKVKKDYDSAAFDTLDLVPVGGWHGQGRKAAWWSPVLLAVRNPETGGLEAVTKCMSGFTDKFYKDMRAKYDPAAMEASLSDNNDDDNDDDDAERKINTLPSKPDDLVYAGPTPSVWFVPQEVWECAFADITVSPTYLAAFGLIHEEKGLSTRFPRFLKVREDKGVEEASTSDYLAELYRRQETTGASVVDDGGHVEEGEDLDDE